MATAEQPRELVLEAGVDAIEGVLEARAGFLVDLAHRLFERVERLGEIGELAVEILLALALFLQLVDGGEVHLAELLEVGARGVQRFLPTRLPPRRQPGRRGLSVRSKRVASNCSMSPSRRTRDSCAARRACSTPARAALTRILGVQTLFVERAQRGVGLFERPALRGELGLDVETPREELLEARFEIDDGLIAARERALRALRGAPASAALLGHALETHARGAFARSGAIRCGSGGRGSRAAPPASAYAPPALPHGAPRARLRARAARIERVQRTRAAVELGARARQRVLREAATRA